MGSTGFAVCGMPFPGEGFTVGASGPPGSGTVTNVSVVTANGVSGTVLNPTTTPAITITLGNITPTSVNTVVISGSSTPTLSVIGTTVVSGTNTGDQTEFSDNTFRIYDNTTPTKKVAFEVSTVSPATTRTLTVPDVNGTITLNTATQTLTNKTVVTPVIQSGMDLVGSTSGTVTIDVPATITDYTLILPPAQGTGALTNDGAGNLSWGGTTGIVGWTPALNTSAPNNTVNASTFTASGGTTNQDAIIQPKGTGAFILQLPDNTATGGNKRGDHAIDLQTGRTVATAVASGQYSFVAGYDNTATQNMSIAIGNTNTSTGNGAIAVGNLNTATGAASVALGAQNTAGGTNAAVALGKENVASGENSVAIGFQNISSGDFSAVIGGATNSNAGAYSVVMGQGLTFTAAADNSFGFLSNPLLTSSMTIASPNTAVFGNVNMWLANNDNTARELRFYEPYNTTGAFPNTANYTAFKAQAQTADVTYTLPAADGTPGQILSTNGSGVLSWATAPSGTVSSVSVVTANGFGGTVANATTTPAITITTGVTGLLKGNGTGVTAAVVGTDYSLIQYWTESLNTSGVNATIPAVQWLATNAATNVDAVIAPKAQGALLAQVPDGTTVGGDKRGINATDFQRDRTVSLQVASGVNSVIVGGRNNAATASYSAVVAGSTNQANGLNGFVGGGNNNRADAAASAVAGGSICVASGVSSFIGSGSSNVASGYASVVAGGNDNVAAGSNAVVLGGYNNTATADNSTIIAGQELTLSSGAQRTIGYNSSPSYTTPMLISTADVAVFGNVDVWLANTRNAASKLKFFTAQNTTGAFPTGSTYYTSFAAGTQSANIAYVLPTAQGAPSTVLTNDGAGNLSWTAGASGDMTLAGVQTVTGAKTFNSGKLIIAGATSGTTTLDATAVAGAGTVTLPTTGTLATLAGTEILSNKTLASPQVTGNLQLNGATSGSVSINTTASPTTYTLTLPPANGAGLLANSGTGQLLWADKPYVLTNPAQGTDATAFSPVFSASFSALGSTVIAFLVGTTNVLVHNGSTYSNVAHGVASPSSIAGNTATGTIAVSSASASTVCRTSTNGGTFSNSSGTIGQTGGGIACNSATNTWLIWDSTVSTSAIARSTDDAATFSTAGLSGFSHTAAIRGCANDGVSTWVFATNSTATLVSTDDGVTFAAGGALATGTTSLGAEYGGGYFVIPGDTTGFNYSTNGSTWSTNKYPVNVNCIMKYANGYWWAIPRTAGYPIFRTADITASQITWTAVLPVGTNTLYAINPPQKIHYFNSNYFISGPYVSNIQPIYTFA